MSGEFENFVYDRKGSVGGESSAEFANPLEMPEEMKVELSKEEKELYNNTKDVARLLDFPISSNECKSISKILKEILDKKDKKVSNKEFGIMFAAALLLVAGSRELVPQNIDVSCVPFKYSDISYVACVLKKNKKYNVEDIDKKLDKAYHFLSKEMNISIAKDSEVRKRKVKMSMSASPEVPSSEMSRVQKSAFYLKRGGPGVHSYVKLPKISGEDPTARKRSRIQNQAPFTNVREIVSKNVLDQFKSKIEEQMKKSEKNKDVYKFIKDNVDKDIEDIEEKLKNIKLKANQDEVKKNIKLAKKSIEEEINERLSNMKL